MLRNLIVLCVCCIPAVPCLAGAKEGPLKFIHAWGKLGKEPGEFHSPIGIAINAKDEIYVAEFRNNRVQKFSADGKFLLQIPVAKMAGGIAVDWHNHIYVAPLMSHKICVYDESGKLLREWGKEGKRDGEFDQPGGIAIAADGTIYVADQVNRRVQRFTPEGKFLGKWGEYGSKPGQFDGVDGPKNRTGGPHFLAFDSKGNIFTTEGKLGRIQKFSPDGKPLLAFGSNGTGPGGFGGRPKNLPGPIGIVIDRWDRIWVSSTNNRVQCFSPDGKYLFGAESLTPGDQPGQFHTPHAMVFDRRDFLYVVDSQNQRVQKFAVPSGPSRPALSPASTRSDRWQAVEHKRATIYHSPQTPGYTSWTGAWLMPGGDLMVAFTQATGPIIGRPTAPEEIMEKLSWHPAYDMTGLDLRNVHLRSADQGKSWKKWSEDGFKSPMNGVTGEAEVALSDGAIIRGVFGYYLPYDPDVPRTGFLQRSIDGSKTWSKPEVPFDPAKYTAWPRRLRVLKDGRLLALFGLARVPANSLTRREYNKILEPIMLVSANGGKNWMEPIEVLTPELRNNWGGEEFDAAELPNGDLLCVFRRGDEKVRWQGVMKKSGKTWEPTRAERSTLPHSGQPELLATQEGPVLHLATTGIDLTTDAGKNWSKLTAPGTAYYPRSLQAKNGRIHVFGHIGGDDAYGKVDQSIVMDSFRLAKE